MRYFAVLVLMKTIIFPHGDGYQNPSFSHPKNPCDFLGKVRAFSACTFFPSASSTEELKQITWL
jgi:hypothetical protein